MRDRAEGGHDRRRIECCEDTERYSIRRIALALYAELALRRSHIALRRARWRLGAARAALESRL